MTDKLEQIEKRTRLNRNGVKASSDMWRTIAGVSYVAWLSYPSPDLIAAYRANGVRCRRLGQELFVHHMDRAFARSIDIRFEECGE